MYTTSIVLFAYIIFMGTLCIRARQFQYLLSAIIFWFGVSLIGFRLLPNIYGLTHLTSLYLAPLFFCFASVFYLVFCCRAYFSGFRLAFESDKNLLLASITFANIFVQVGFLLFTVIVWMIYPTHLRYYFLSGIFLQYALQPIWVIGLTMTVTGLIYLYTKLNQNKTIKLTLTQGVFFCCMVLLTALIAIILPLLQLSK